MALTRINNNISALNATRNLNTTAASLQRSLERLSSGLRINRAADDASGLTISERQRSQIRGLNRAIANAQDAIGLINTAEGALNETTSRLQRIRELAVQAANTGGLDVEAIIAAQDEINTSIAEITRIGNDTQFSTRRLLNGDYENFASIKTGTPDRGVSIAQTALSSTLSTGTHYLVLTRTAVGSETLGAGADAVNNSNLTAITGSTFKSGEYDVVVNNARAAAARVQNVGDFTRDDAGNVALASNLVDMQIGGNGIDAGDVFVISGTAADGTAITAVTLSVSAGTTYQALRDAISTAFADATASANVGEANSTLTLTDDAAGTSLTSLTLTFTDTSAATDFTYNSAVTTAGNNNDAVVSIGGGPAQTVEQGQTVTFYGITPTSGAASERVPPQITVTLGALTNGTDTLTIVQQAFTASLNNGTGVSFQNGDQNVLLRSGTSAGFASGEQLVLNFGAAIDVTGLGPTNAQTVIISAVNNGLSFQIGANTGQQIVVGLGDLRSSRLGFVETGLTVDRIDVTTLQGANDAINIIDRALEQVSRQRSYLGATTNRLEATISNLGVASENLAAAESRIRDADIAFETTLFTRNQILIQAGTAILAQANLQPQAILQLLG